MPDENVQSKIPLGFKLRHTLRGHEGIIHQIAWAPDGRMIASGSHDRTACLWDTETGCLLYLLRAHAGPVKSVVWSPNGSTLASVAGTNAIRLWDTKTGRQNRVIARSIYSHRLEWSPDGQTIASTDDGGRIYLWDVKTGELSLELNGHSDAVTDIKWAFDGKTLASASVDKTIRLWDNSTGALRQTLKGHSGSIRCLAWSPDSRTIASGADDNAIRLWDADTGQLTTILERHTNIISSLSFSFDGRLLSSKSNDKIIRLWRCEDWESIIVLNESSCGKLPVSLAFHPSLPILATLGENDSVIRIWDVDIDSIVSITIKSESINYTTVKIALVGDSGVGKTGLGWRIARGEFKEHPSTHGQQFWIVDDLGAKRDDKTECEAVLWDFAGQPDYRLVHALFLDNVDLALVLFDPTNRIEPLKGVEYWLKHLSQKSELQPAILVGARVDRGTTTLTGGELEEFCQQNGVSGGYISTSAQTGEGITELLESIKAAINWDLMTATVTTATFKRVKEFVLSLKEQSDRKGVLLSPAELRMQLESIDSEWNFTDAEMMTAVRHLATHGYVSVLRGSQGEEKILLAPDILANLASSLVLEARRNEKGLGALDEARVLRGEYKFPELTNLETRERDVLLDAAVMLFLEHNLCFRETLGTQTLLIFPALINQKRPLLKEIETVDDFLYRVSGAVENVYAALVVQLGYTNTFTRTNQWQNQAEYETAHGDVCGFRQVDEREGEIELVLYYAKEKTGARLLFQGLFEQFLRGRDVNVTKFPPVPCPKCGYWQQRVEVVKRIGEGKGFLFCGECGAKIKLPKAGESVAFNAAERVKLGREQGHTRQRTAFESALVRVKAVVRDETKKMPNCFVSYAWGNEDHERWVRAMAKDLENAGIEVILDQKDNPQIGANVSRFISRIEQSDFVIVIGTPLYKQKYENEASESGSVVAAEVNLINLRLTRTNSEAETVLPLLLKGNENSSLPPLMRGKVYADFRKEPFYFNVLFDLILTIFKIPFDYPGISDLRGSLRSERP